MRKNRLMTVLLIMFFAGILASMFILRNAGTIALASPSENDWPMFRHDPAHTGYSDTTAPDTNRTIWTYKTNAEVFSSPAVADGKVYFGSADGNVYCLYASNGTGIWNYTTAAGIWCSPAVADGKVYIGSDDSRVYCLNASTGIHIWNHTTDNSVESSPAVVDGKVYIGSFDGYIYCLNASDGNQIWRYWDSNWVFSSPAVVDDRVYVASATGYPAWARTYCLNASTGVSIWSRTSYTDIWSSPAVAGDKVYMGGNQVYCLNASDGTIIWSYAVASDSSPAVYVDRVYIGTYGNNMSCLNASDGTSIWNYTTGGEVFSSPAVADGKVYVGSADNNSYCLNASSGAKIWSYLTNGTVYSSPSIANGTAYIGSHDGNLYAFHDTYDLTITAGYGGTTDPAPGTYRYDENTTVTVTATSSSGYGFDHWELDGYLNYSNPIDVTMSKDHELHAIFQYNVTIKAHCTTEGSDVAVSITMNETPTGYLTPCNFTIEGGTHTFTVADVDPSGHFFKQWDTGENSTTITVNSAGTYTAYYQAKYNLTITTTDGGTTDPEPGNYTYWDGASVNVNATPSLGYIFDHGELNTTNIGNSNPITVTMDASHTLKAAFSWVGTCNLTITTTVGGTTDPAPDTYTYTNGTVINIAALQDEGFDFSHWELDDVWNYSNPIVVTMNLDHDLHAVFTYRVTIDAYCYKEDAGVNVNVTMDGSLTGYATPQMFNVTGTHSFTVPDVDLEGHFFKQWNTGENSTTITVDSAGTYTAYYQAKYNLTITATTGGTTDPSPGIYSYWNGTSVDVLANSTLGYALDHWELDDTDIGSENPTAVTMDSNYTLKAVFKILYTLEITTTGNGTTDPPPDVYVYIDGTMVPVTGIPLPDYGFDHWELDGFTAYFNPINVTMDRDHVLIAVFNHNVTIEAFCITENVTLNLDITMDNLPTNYTTPYTFVLVGTHNFTVPETDPNGHYFEQWSTGETNTTITVASPPVLTANYKVKWELTIDKVSGGTTDPPPRKHKYYEGTIANVTALPSLGYLLDHWLLDTYPAGSSNPISITMDADHTLQPVFSWVGICNLTITATTGGTTTPSPGTYEYANGTIVDVIALIDEGHGLHHWELDKTDAGSPNPITVTMDANHTLNAVFKAVYDLTITATSGGTTDPPPGIYSYWEGSSVTVTATEYAGFAFDHWLLDSSPEYPNPINIEMYTNRALNAIFVYNVTIRARCSIEGALSVNISMDGSLTVFKTPHTFTGLTGTHTFTVPGADPNEHPFLSWIWGSSWSTNLQLSVNKNGTYEAVYSPPVPPSRVGGRYYSVDMTLLLAPHIVLAVILFALTVITGARVKHLRRREQ